MNTKKLTLCAMLCAVAIILGYIESLFPLPIAIPGVKLGLGNIAILICLYLVSAPSAWCVMLIKVLTSVILFSPPSTLIYSLFGGVLALIAMYISKKFKFNIISVSILGGIFHNLGQLSAACLILDNINAIYYLPFMIIAGRIVACATRMAAKIIIRRISKLL